MKNRRKKGENSSVDEEGEKQRHGISTTALTVQEMKSSSSSSSSKQVGRKRREEQPIHWDRFLSRRLLTVLLVENDESTRLLVTALLRKCSYQVSAVADGRKAWEALKEKDHKVDIVLTEVVIPCLSGFDLLSRIMNNERCKNIPVVMMASHDAAVMSSHDSLGVVLRCMLKGAADFLTKPVRNNELRNLWQHVWRKYCATLETVSDNVAAIDCGISSSRMGSRTGDNSDEESDSQRSYCDTEVKNGGGLKLKENPESENENYVQQFDCESTEPECYVFNDKGKAKAEAAGEEINLSLSIRVPGLAPNILKPNGFYKGSPCSTEIRFSSGSKEDASLDSEHIDRIGGTNEPSKEIIDFIGATITKQSKCPIMENKDHAEDIICENEKPSVIRRSTLDSGSSQLLELSLWGPQLRFSDDEVFQEKNALSCSRASDFSRYDVGKIPVSCPISGSSAVSLCMRVGDSDSANYHINSSNCVENHQSHQLKQVMEDQKVNIKSSYPAEMVSTSYERVDQIGKCNLHVTDTSGSNGCNDGTSATETGTALNGGNRDGLQNIKGTGLNHRCTRREAALTRFRLKRKNRFLGEKVRYYGRKKLAEQRPRLKGRFVHQAVTKPDDSGMDD